jgi:DnaJ-domain-containing protein 1
MFQNLCRKREGAGINAERARRTVQQEPDAPAILSDARSHDAQFTSSTKKPCAVRIPIMTSELLASSADGEQPNSSEEQQRLQRLERLLQLMVAKV